MQAPARLLCTPPPTMWGRFCFVCGGVLRPHYKISPRLVVRRARPMRFYIFFVPFRPSFLGILWHSIPRSIQPASRCIYFYILLYYFESVEWVTPTRPPQGLRTRFRIIHAKKKHHGSRMASHRCASCVCVLFSLLFR